MSEQNFLLSKLKCFATEHKVSRGNANVLWVSAMLLWESVKVYWGKQNTFQREQHFCKESQKQRHNFSSHLIFFPITACPEELRSTVIWPVSWRKWKWCPILQHASQIHLHAVSERSFAWIKCDGMGSYHGFSSKAIAALHVDNTKKLVKNI